MYSVHQHWDPLKVCAVGKSYPPEFYSFITNSRVRSVMERIAQETEEDYQKLVKLLESFGVEVLRPDIGDSIERFWTGTRYLPPPMTPRDDGAMVGTTFYLTSSNICQQQWQDIGRGVPNWPLKRPDSTLELLSLPKEILDIFNSKTGNRITEIKNYDWCWKPMSDQILAQGNKIVHNFGISSATVSRIGKDLYFGTAAILPQEQIDNLKPMYNRMFPTYRSHIINTGGHSDATYCPVKPGLIISLHDIPTYADTFPDWEVVYLPGQSWTKVEGFLRLKEKNKGKWWVPGEELNDDFTEFVEGWLNHWVGYVEETVFDVNMLVIDEKNVVCNNYNKQVFDAFNKHGITAHVINFRHRFFWDGGLHCITSDLNREGTMKDYFPERG